MFLGSNGTQGRGLMFAVFDRLLRRHRDRVEPEEHRSGYYVSLVGVEDGKDGLSRQKEIRKCAVGEAVELVSEPDEEHGPNAIAVYRRKTSRRLGFLPQDAATAFAERIKSGDPYPAAVYEKTGGYKDAPMLGLRLRIETHSE